MKTLKELKASIEVVKNEVDAFGQSLQNDEADNDETIAVLEDVMSYLDSAVEALNDADES